MKQLQPTTLDFYVDSMNRYDDDELNRYLFDLQTAVDAVEKRITELHNENERGIVNMDGTVEKFNGEY